MRRGKIDRARLAGESVIAAVRGDLEAGGFKLSSLSPQTGDKADYLGNGIWEGAILSSVFYTIRSSEIVIGIESLQFSIKWRFDERTRAVLYQDVSDPVK
ncbi:MAG: hypothetical protein Q8O43_06595 [Dehalococcoidia bacterium]|nr:hypothetical protein [Dehalococcoidia bacterium]